MPHSARSRTLQASATRKIDPTLTGYATLASTSARSTGGVAARRCAFRKRLSGVPRRGSIRRYSGAVSQQGVVAGVGFSAGVLGEVAGHEARLMHAPER